MNDAIKLPDRSSLTEKKRHQDYYPWVVPVTALDDEEKEKVNAENLFWKKNFISLSACLGMNGLCSKTSHKWADIKEHNWWGQALFFLLF